LPARIGGLLVNWWDLGEWAGTSGVNLAIYQIECAFCGETGSGSDGKPYKTRAGGVAQLSDLLVDAIDKARERVVASDATLDHERLAQLVGLAAIKFADLSSFRTSGYIFDAERLVSFEGRTGP